MTPENPPDARMVEAAAITVAVVTGACAGAEFESVIDADVRIAGDGATFSSAGVRDPVGCARRLTRLLGEARAKELMLGGRTVSAADGLRLGLVTRVVPTPEIGEAVRALEAGLRALPPLALRAVRDAVRATRDLTPRDALALEHEHFRRLIATRDHKAAVAAFLGGREPAFTGQ
jgi:2-(1,2-epoxy-1,2-dihydrophenyl)acetyl-CoA isomerase